MKSKLAILAVVAACALPMASVLAGEIAVVVNPKNPASRMFSEQAAQFFLGKSTQFTPIERAESPLKNEFDQKVLGKDPATVKSIWSKLVFTGKGTAPKEYTSNAEVKKAVAADVSAIGYIDKSAVDDTVKVILTVQ